MIVNGSWFRDLLDFLAVVIRNDRSQSLYELFTVGAETRHNKKAKLCWIQNSDTFDNEIFNFFKSHRNQYLTSRHSHPYKAAGIRHNGLYLVNCIRINCSSENITVLDSWQVCDERILLRFFNDKFHIGVMQIRLNFILHQILYVYPRIKFINKGLSTVHKLNARCDSLKAFFYIDRN